MAALSNALAEFTCGICLSSFTDDGVVPTTTPCGHSYCVACITDWLRRNPADPRCPACRASIPRAPPAANVALRDALAVIQVLPLYMAA